MSQLGKYLFLFGILLALAGLILWLGGNRLHWLGRLPGDIRIEKGNTRIFIPLATMLLLSLAVTLLVWLYRKFFGG